MGRRRRVVVVGYPNIVRQGLKALISGDPSLEIVGESSEGRDALRCIAETEPALVVIDLCVPGIPGIDIVREVRKGHSTTGIVALGAHRNEGFVCEILDAGVNGYVLKDADAAELTTAIHRVLDGRTYLSREINEWFVLKFASADRVAQEPVANHLLTPREQQILKLIAESRSNKEIADYLCISVKTIETHRSNLMRKLDLHNAAALTRYALAHGLLDDQEISPPTTKRVSGLSAVRLAVLASLASMDWAAEWMAVVVV